MGTGRGRSWTQVLVSTGIARGPSPPKSWQALCILLVFRERLMLGYRNILVLGLSAFLAAEGYAQHGRSSAGGGGSQFSTEGLSQIASRNNRNLQMRRQ